MVIDTSAIFAAITGEPDSGVYCNAIISAPLRLISAVTLFGNADRPGFAERQPVDSDAKCNALHRLASSANSSAKKRSRFKSAASTGL